MKKLTLITIFFITALFLVVPAEAYTAHTQAEAVNWMRSKVGSQIDADGSDGVQCVDLILAYYDYLGVPRSSGNGADYTYNTLPAGWNRIQNAAPQPGDILVYTVGFGHVALYESDYVTYHQNFSGAYVERVTYKYNGFTNPYWGVIRPDFTTTPPTPPQPTLKPSFFGADFYAYIVNSESWKHLENYNRNVQLPKNGNDSSDPKQIWHFLYQSDNSYKIINEYDGTCLDAANMASDNGTNVATFTDNGLAAQRWYLCWKDDLVMIKSTYCDRVLDLANGSTEPLTNVQLYQPNYTAAQKFSIYELTSDKVYYKRIYMKDIAPPQIISADEVSNGIRLSWTELAKQSTFDNRNYTVQVWDDTVQSVDDRQNNNTSSTSIVLSLTPGKKYYARVFAYNTKYLNDYTVGDTYTFYYSGNQILKGDTNSDNKVNAIDALNVLKHSAGLIKFTDAQKTLADVDGNGMINAKDALLILRYAAGLEKW